MSCNFINQLPSTFQKDMSNIGHNTIWTCNSYKMNIIMEYGNNMLEIVCSIREELLSKKSKRQDIHECMKYFAVKGMYNSKWYTYENTIDHDDNKLVFSGLLKIIEKIERTSPNILRAIEPKEIFHFERNDI